MISDQGLSALVHGIVNWPDGLHIGGWGRVPCHLRSSFTLRERRALESLPI